MTDLIDTTEMYLRTIFELEEAGIPPLRARIAERLGHSGPTVSQTVAKMERDGLLHVSEDRRLVLTDQGQLLATRVMRKHRIAERLLVDVIGLEWEHAHDEACRWEHVMSERVERKILHLLSDRGESPYGNPIPGLEELAEADERDGVPNLEKSPISQWDTRDHHLRQEVGGIDIVEATAGLPNGKEAVLLVRRLGEELQADAQQLASLLRVGVLPGAQIHAARVGSMVTVRSSKSGGAQELSLPLSAAQHLFVSSDSRPNA